MHVVRVFLSQSENAILTYVIFVKPLVCQEALGMENGDIPDAKITASSEYSDKHSTDRARLHLQKTRDYNGGWSSLTNDANQWLQVDLGTQYTRVTRVATQGRNKFWSEQWVTKYKLQYSNDELTFQYYREQGQTTYKVNSHSRYRSYVSIC